MADPISSDQIVNFIQAQQSQYGGDNAQSQAAIAAAMDQYGVTPAQVAAAIGAQTSVIQSDYNNANPTGSYYVAPSAATTANTGIASVAAAPVVNTQPDYSGIASIAPPATPTPTTSVAASTPTTPIATPDTSVNTQPDYSNFPTPTTPAPTAPAPVPTPIPTQSTPTPTSAPGIDPGVMTQMEQAYATGNYNQLNSLIKSNNISTTQLQSIFGLSQGTLNNILAEGVMTTDSPTGVPAFQAWYSAHPNATNAEIGQAISNYGVSTTDAAKVTGVDQTTADQNYLSLAQLQQQNPGLTNGINAITQGGQITQQGTDESNNPQYYINNQAVTKNPDGTYSYMVGNNTRGGYDTITFSVDANGNAIAPSDMASAYKWTPGSDASVVHGLGQALVSVGNAVAPAVSMALSMFPATAPYMAALNAYNAAKGGNYVGALVSALSAAGGFGQQTLADADALAKAGDMAGAAAKLDGAMGFLANNAGALKTTAQVVSGLDAASKGNYVGALTSAANIFNTGINKDVGTALNFATAAKALQSGDNATFLLAVGNLTNSPDAKTAAAAVRLQTAINNGANPASIGTAFQSLITTANGGTTTTAPTVTKADAGSDTPITTAISDTNDFSTFNPRTGGDNALPIPDPKNYKPNEIILDIQTGMPLYKNVYDPFTQTGQMVPFKQDASGNYYYVDPVSGQTTGASSADFERAFYKANPQEYLNMAQTIYGQTGNIDQINAAIQDHLKSLGLTNTSGATPVTTINVDAKDVTSKATPSAPSNFSDFLSRMNIKGLLGGETSEITSALSMPEVANLLSRAQDTGYMNDIVDYFNNAGSQADQLYYQGLMKDLVAQNPTIGNDQKVQDIINQNLIPDLGTVTITGKKDTTPTPTPTPTPASNFTEYPTPTQPTPEPTQPTPKPTQPTPKPLFSDFFASVMKKVPTYYSKIWNCHRCCYFSTTITNNLILIFCRTITFRFNFLDFRLTPTSTIIYLISFQCISLIYRLQLQATP